MVKLTFSALGPPGGRPGAPKSALRTLTGPPGCAQGRPRGAPGVPHGLPRGPQNLQNVCPGAGFSAPSAPIAGQRSPRSLLDAFGSYSQAFPLHVHRIIIIFLPKNTHNRPKIGPRSLKNASPAPRFLHPRPCIPLPFPTSTEYPYPSQRRVDTTTLPNPE